MGSPMGQRLRLAGTGTGEQQKRPAAVGYRLCLLGSQLVKQTLRSGRRAAARFSNWHRITS
jgi:hypothetical protein